MNNTCYWTGGPISLTSVITKGMAFLTCLAWGACSNDPPTFITYTEGAGVSGNGNYAKAPVLTDALALNYANAVESICRARSTGSRYTREASEVVIATLAAVTAAAGVFSWGSTTVAVLGIGTSGVASLQGIFDAKTRANAYFGASTQIHAAIQAYLAAQLAPSGSGLSQTLVSDQLITNNGWILVNTVQANIDAVDKTLNGILLTADEASKTTFAGSRKALNLY